MSGAKYDFFISHASEDKNDFVRPLAMELRRKGYKIWYDEFSIEIGDSLVQSIIHGIKESLYGIIVLSNNFFNKKWTKKELEALLHKEVLFDKNLILPVWLEVSSKDVYDFSPLLIDKLAISVKKGDTFKTIEAIEKKSGICVTTGEDIQNQINYLISCNNDRRNKYFIDLEYRLKNIYHFQIEYYNWYTSDGLFKSDDDWDQNLVDIKGKEFQAEYNIPIGVWLVPEPFSILALERAIKLCSKWVSRSLKLLEALELHFVLNEVLDTDVHYILYGFPHSSLKSKEAINTSSKGIIEVGIQNEKMRVINESELNKFYPKMVEKYYTE